MGVLGLHNECPPTNYSSAEAPEIIQGLVSDAVATSATLRAVRDCMESLASLDDTVRYVVEASGLVAAGKFDQLADQRAQIEATYDGCFRALDKTDEMITEAIQQYVSLQGYAAAALANGRDECYENTLRQLGEGGFTGMAQARIARLRKLRVRVQLLQRMEDYGRRIIANNEYGSFFMLFMQPMRDLGISAQDLYNEVVRGALVAYETLVRVCDVEAAPEMNAQMPPMPAGVS